MRSLFIGMIICLALTSCGSFQRMHYRDLPKVPAAPADFTESRSSTRVVCTPQIPNCADTTECEVLVTGTAPEQRCSETEDVMMSGSNSLHYEMRTDPVMKNDLPQKSLPIRRDLSPGVALFLIVVGFFILAYCVLLLPFIGFELGWIVILELLLSYSAVNMILRGAFMLRNRLRSRNNYKEN